MICEKKEKSGPLLEVDFYPTWENGKKIPTRAPKSKPSTIAQIEYNEKVARKKLIRLVNANFDSVDYFGHLTYYDSKAPQKESEARRDITNFMRRVKRHREKRLKEKKAALKEAKDDLAARPHSTFLADSVKQLKKEIKHLKRPLKYVYTEEKTVHQRGRYAGKANWHFHLFITGGLTPAEMKALWNFGLVLRFENYLPQKFGPARAALYISKDPQGRKRFAYSKNLKKPKTSKRGSRFSRGGVERLCTERVDDAAYWERRYKGYRFLKCYPLLNPYNGHWYLSVVMYKTGGDDPPEWKEEEWNTEAGAA